MIKVGLSPGASYAKQMIEQLKSLGELTVEDFALFDGIPQVTQQLPTKQPRRKTGVAQARHNARKRRNRK
ncbi:hypothetical protein SP069_00020 [Salmonella phage SP069]|uniref:Uncharacterized protein n=2 Tax=Nonanavirus TaxID=1921122 RepID=S4TU49_9CAUD|nr:hypothetical protein QII00_sAgp04 [Salmonella phage SP069]AGF89350.1 hypothetical protein SP062_00350 [Salmonella phage FSL SP-062]AGF89503.1 hypothetical protein SP069_00020 [Salmonella phage SP069]